MHKSSTRFFVVSLVAAVLATGCAHKPEAGAATPSDTATTGAGMEAQRQTSEVDVTSTKWANVTSGPATVVGVVGVGRFDGESACYASTSATCPNASTPVADLGTPVYSCSAGTCSAQNGGRVESGRNLCCGAIKGSGGKLRVVYMK